MATKKITLNELRSLVKKIIKEESEKSETNVDRSKFIESSLNRTYKNKIIAIDIFPKEDKVTILGKIDNIQVTLFGTGYYHYSVRLINCKTNDIQGEFKGEIRYSNRNSWFYSNDNFF